MIKQFQIVGVPSSFIMNDGRVTKVNVIAAAALKQTFNVDGNFNGFDVMTVISEKAKNYGSINSFKRDFQVELEDWSENPAELEALPEEVEYDNDADLAQAYVDSGEASTVEEAMATLVEQDDDAIEEAFNETAASDSSHDDDEPVNLDDTKQYPVTDLKVLKALLRTEESKNKGSKVTILVTGETKTAKIVSADGIKRPLMTPKTFIDATVTNVGNKWMTIEDYGTRFYVKSFQLGAYVTINS